MKRKSSARPPSLKSKTARQKHKPTTSVSLLPDDRDQLDWLIQNDPLVEGVTDALRYGMRARRSQIEQTHQTLAVEAAIDAAISKVLLKQQSPPADDQRSAENTQFVAYGVRLLNWVCKRLGVKISVPPNIHEEIDKLELPRTPAKIAALPVVRYLTKKFRRRFARYFDHVDEAEQPFIMLANYCIEYVARRCHTSIVDGLIDLQDQWRLYLVMSPLFVMIANSHAERPADEAFDEILSLVYPDRNVSQKLDALGGIDRDTPVIRLSSKTPEESGGGARSAT